MSAQRLLVGFDGSEPSRAALAWAAGVAQREHGSLTVVLVLNQAWWCSTGAAGFSLAPAACEIERASIEVLHKAIAELDHDVSVVSLVAHGTIATALARAAERYCCTAIVIGRGQGFWSRLTGGVARWLRRRTSLPVIAVPAEGSATRAEAAAGRRRATRPHPVTP